ncbi:heme oxygenase [Rhizina undulata]
MSNIRIDQKDIGSLTHRINTENRDAHDRVNGLVVSRLPLGLKGPHSPPHFYSLIYLANTNREFLDYRCYREGLLSFFHAYATFGSCWNSLLTERPSNVPPHVYTSLQSLWIPEIARTNPLLEDLEHFYGKTAFAKEPDTKERKKCCEHIKTVVREKPHVLIAYAHNYYMALFAGGRRLRYLIQHASKEFFPLREGLEKIEERQIRATGLFRFEGWERGQEEKLRARFKEVMGEIDAVFSEEDKKYIIEESREFFVSCERIIKELDEICAKQAVSFVPRESLESKAVAKFTVVKKGNYPHLAYES